MQRMLGDKAYKDQRGKAFVLIFMDLDFFKPVNDTYGHPAGDKVLCNVGKRIINSILTADYAIRITYMVIK